MKTCDTKQSGSPAASFDELSMNMNREVFSTARHLYHSTECIEQNSPTPRTAAAQVPKEKPAVENVVDVMNQVGRPDIGEAQPRQARMQDTGERGNSVEKAAAVDCYTKLMLSSPVKCHSKSVGNSVVPTPVEACGDNVNAFCSHPAPLKTRQLTKKSGLSSGKEALARLFKGTLRQNEIVVVWDAVWRDFKITSLILRRRMKKLSELLRKLAVVLVKVLAKLALLPHEMVKVLHALSNSSITRRVLTEFRWKSVAAWKFVVYIVKFLVRVALSLQMLLRHRIIPGTRSVAAKTYCLAMSFFLYLMYKSQGSWNLGHMQITLKFSHNGFINPFALHDFLGVPHDDVFSISNPAYQLTWQDADDSNA